MTALYAGSFDPFTNGHADIVQEAARIFDELIVCVADNSSKRRRYNSAVMVVAIQDWLNSCKLSSNVTVILNRDKLTVDIAKMYNAHYLVRGLRSTSDYIYEEEIARFNYMQDPTLRTIYIRALNEISSSAVCEMIEYGKDIQHLVPRSIFTVLGGCNNGRCNSYI